MKCPKCCQPMSIIVEGANRDMWECEKCNITVWI